VALPSPALHRSIVVVDVAGFTDRSRTEVHQVAVHHGLYDVLNEAFSVAGIDLAVCAVEDCGEGAMILVPPEIPKSVLANRLPGGLIAALRRYNAVHSAEASVQLRVVLHAGEVSQDANGVVGQAINLAFRILDAGAAKLALRRTRPDRVWPILPGRDRARPSGRSGRLLADPGVSQGYDDQRMVTLARQRGRAGPTGRSYQVRSATPAMGIRRGIVTTIGRPQNLRRFVGYTLAVFGLIAIVAQAAGISSLTNLRDSAVCAGTVIVLCVCYGLWSIWPITRIHREFRYPAVRVAVVVGNLFDQQAQLVVGFADIFDTDTTDDRIVNGASVQGQFLYQAYGGDRDRLDRDLADALCHIRPSTVESRRDKPQGKLERYPVGTSRFCRVPGLGSSVL
jgi:Thoeris protein ThsA, Macro domain